MISAWSVLGILTIIYLLIPNIISSDRVKDKVINMLERKLDYEIEIDDIDMHWPGNLNIKNVTLREKSVFAENRSAKVKVDNIKCKIELFHLIKKQIKISSLTIDKPEFTIYKNKIDTSSSSNNLSKKAALDLFEQYKKNLINTIYISRLDIPLFFDIDLSAIINNGKAGFINEIIDEEMLITDLNAELKIQSQTKQIEFDRGSS